MHVWPNVDLNIVRALLGYWNVHSETQTKYEGTFSTVLLNCCNSIDSLSLDVQSTLMFNKNKKWSCTVYVVYLDHWVIFILTFVLHFLLENTDLFIATGTLLAVTREAYHCLDSLLFSFPKMYIFIGLSLTVTFI